MEYIFKIEHLDCANCANKIEVRLNKEPYIKEAMLNFMRKKLKVVLHEQMSEEDLRQKVEKLADDIEKGVKIVSELKGQEEEETVAHMHCEGTSHEAHHHGEGCHHHEEHHHKEECHCHEEHHHIEGGKQGQSSVETAAYTEPSTPAGKMASYNKRLGSKLQSLSREARLLILSIVLLIFGAVFELDILFIAAYICAGYDVVAHAFKNLLKGRMLDENFLMTIATIAAFIIGQYPEAVAVMVFYKIGELLQAKAVDYSRKEIEKAMDIRPSFARVLRGNPVVVSPEKVKVGEVLEVRVGERIPLDGVVIEGSSTLDMSMLTGEALPVQVSAGGKVLSGSINKDGVLLVKVEIPFTESTVSKILELIENATNKKSKSENFITKFARWYTPIVVLLAAFTAIVPSMVTGNYEHWIYTSIIFLVISCPCALVVSVPLGFFAGIGASARVGVLVKGSNYLEALNTIDTVLLDKTGTITKGNFGVAKIIEGAGSKEEVLKLAALLESHSNHPIARSIVERYGKLVDVEALKDYQEISGEGITAFLEGERILVGNQKLMHRFNISYTIAEEIGSHVYVAKGNRYLGCIVVADELKEGSKEAIKRLKTLGIKKVMMLTGDKKEIAEEVGRVVGVDEVWSELLPQHKVEKLEAALKEGKTIFVGDGINDAPVLARADVGIAMGGVGSDAAVEAADIVLMKDDLNSIGDVLEIAKRTRVIVTENVVFALGIKLIVLVLGLVGIANMWLAIFADVGVSLIAVINSIRVLGKDISYLFKMVKSRQ